MCVCVCVCVCACVRVRVRVRVPYWGFGTAAGWIEYLQQLATCHLLSITQNDTPAPVIDGAYGNSTSITSVMGSWYREWENVDGVKSTQLLLWIVSSNYAELTIYLPWWIWQSISRRGLDTVAAHTRLEVTAFQMHDGVGGASAAFAFYIVRATSYILKYTISLRYINFSSPNLGRVTRVQTGTPPNTK